VVQGIADVFGNRRLGGIGLTRTKKKCAILVAKNAMGNFKQRSDFLGWIKPERFATKKVDAAYWR
jgi:hypothetical protein